MREEKNLQRIELIKDFILPLIYLLFLFFALLFLLLAILSTWFLILRTIFQVFPNLPFEFALIGSIIINLVLWAILFAQKTIERKLKKQSEEAEANNG